MADNSSGGIPLIGLLGSLGSGLIGGIGSYLGAQAQAQAQAINHATDIQNQQYQTSLGLLQPSIDAGNTARSYQLGALGLPGGVDASTATAAFRNSPGYQFGLKTGENGVQTSAAANGSLFSGKTLKDLDTYASGMADQNFNQWLGNVGGISGSGQSATGQAVNLGSASGTNLADLAMQGGANQASSYQGIGNAAGGSLHSLSDLYNYYNPPSWVSNLSSLGKASGAPINLLDLARS